MKRVNCTVGLGVLVTLLAVTAGAAESPAAPVFGPRPRLMYTAAEIAAWKADPARSNELAAAVARADGALKGDLTVPDKEGEWIFYYACPKDNGWLQPETAERHVCPTCKTVYTDARTVAAGRTQRNYLIDGWCNELGVGYALTSDEKYAKPVRDILLKLAALYPKWERHDRWGRTGLLAAVGGRRYAQLLDEAVSSIKLATAYDLVASAPCFTDKDRKTVEEELLERIAKEIRTFQFFAGSRNNHQTWFNAGYANVAVATADAELLNEAIYGGSGLLWQLDNSVTEDGVWYEGANAYHFYALSAIQQTLDAVKRVGWDFSGNARLKSLWIGPLNMAYPNGFLPVFNDSDPANLSNFASFYKWAYGYFKDPVFALYGGVDAGGGATKPVLKSTAMKGIGVVALRRGAGDASVCAMMDYGIHGDHHGHPDKLNVVLYALGQEYVLDPGRIGYSVPEYESWSRTTVAHNTVVINGRNQEATTGDFWFFAETNTYAAALSASDGAYADVQLKRFLVLTDDLLVDVFTVEGDRKATMDWVLHCRGSVTSSVAFKPAESPEKGNGYQHLRSVQTAKGSDSVRFTFDQAGKPLTVMLAGDSESTIYTGIGIGYRLDDAVPFVMRRRTGKATAFVTVYDLSGATRGEMRVERLSVKAQDKDLPECSGLGLKITRGTSGVLVGLDMRKKPEGAASVAGQTFERVLLQPLSMP